MLLLLCACCSAKPFLVQDRGGLPKESTRLEMGQQFYCNEDNLVMAEGIKVYFAKGTVGFRLGERDFFIARGEVSVGLLPVTDPKLLLKPKKITLRFLRGVVHSKGNDDFAFHPDGQVRWFNRPGSKTASIQIDNLTYHIKAKQILAAHEQVHILEENLVAFGTLVLKENYKLNRLIVDSRVIAETKAARSTRNRTVDAFVQHNSMRRERAHFADQARRANRY